MQHTEQAKQSEQQATTSLVLIETNGTVKGLKAKDATLDTLYKKCGFRTGEDFTRQHTWEVKLSGSAVGAKTKHIISVWAKKVGKANFENKYDFPPPIDTALFFGTCVVVRTDEAGNLIDLTKETWTKIYEKLFGGFEDLDKSEEASEDELEGIDPSLLTANGYLKDGFVVSDKDSVENSEDEGVSVSNSVSVSVSKSISKSVGKSVEKKPKKEKKEVVVKENKEPKAEPNPKAVAEPKAKAIAEPKAKAVAEPKAKAVAEPKAKAVAEPKPKATVPKEKKPIISKKSAPKPVVPESEDEESVSELEEEVYTFSDEE